MKKYKAVDLDNTTIVFYFLVETHKRCIQKLYENPN